MVNHSGLPFNGKLLITPGTRKKANLAVAVLKELRGAPTEYYSYLLADDTKPNLVRDIYLPGNQSNSGSHTAISAEELGLAARDILEKGHTIAGWSHAHPGFSTTPSSTDVNNNITVLNQLAPSNLYVMADGMRRCGSRLELMVQDAEESSLVKIRTDSHYVPQVQFDIKKGGLRSLLVRMLLPKLTAQNLKVQVPHIIGYAFSLVVNGIEGQEHAEIIYIDNCAFCNAPPVYKREPITLETVEVPDDIVVSTGLLRKELHEKVR